MSKIVLENFNEGNGSYKVNLAYLNEEQVKEIEGLVKKWNPELKESEDERIRKELICFLETEIPQCNARDKYIAWLKKQGEQIKPIFEVGDVMRTKEEATKGLKSGMPIVVSIDSQYYHCNNELIEIKDQYDYEYPPMNKKQKSAWSEEDEKIVLSIEQVMSCAFLLNIVPEKRDKIKTWLKSLRNRVQPKPNQKWSEEDKKIIDRIESEFLALYRGDYKNIDFNDVDSLTVLIWVRKLKHLCF